jgi:iron complex transport system permease protein
MQKVVLQQLIIDKKIRKSIVILVILLLLTFLISLSIGRFNVPISQTVKILVNQLISLTPTWTDQMENIVINVRLPRILGAILIGSALSISGVSYQGLFRNPLVSPDLLGVSAGACVGAAIAILLGMGSWGIEISALVFGFITVLMTVTIPRFFRNKSTLMLVLAGVLMSGFMNSIMGVLKYIADPDNELATIVYWTMGSLASVRWRDLAVCGPIILIFIVVLLLLRWRINILAVGEHDAYSLGMNVKRMRGIVIVCSTVLTATAVCISGTIGWVGLIVPHMGRILVGQDNRYLMPTSALFGGCFMLVIDTLARNITGSEIPLSILTGMIGVPLFIWLISIQKTRIS